MSNHYYRIGDLLTFGVFGESPDSRVLCFQLRRCEIDPPTNDQVDIAWYPNPDQHPIPQDAKPVIENTEIDTQTAYVRRNNEGHLECFGEGHNFEAIFHAYMAQRGAILVHAAGLTLDDRGVIVCGRGGIGKSSLSFAAFHDDRLRLLSDDKIIVNSDRRVFSFPTPHAIYAYHHALLPLSVQRRFRSSKTQSRILGPLYENPVTRPIGRAAKRWLVSQKGRIGIQAARVRPHYVQVHSDEIFSPNQLVTDMRVDLFIFLSRDGDVPEASPMDAAEARSLLLSATDVELDLERAIALYAQTSLVDLVDYWTCAGKVAEDFLTSCPRLIRAHIPRNYSPEETQIWLLNLLTENLSGVVA